MAKNLETIQAETLAKTQEKKPRGRPPKDLNPNHPATMNHPTNNPLPITSGLKPTFAALFEFSGRALALSLSFKPFELDKPETELLSDQADQVMVEFFPNPAQSKWIKLSALITTLLAVFGKRFFQYEGEKRKKENPEIKAIEEKNQNKNSNLQILE